MMDPTATALLITSIANLIAVLSGVRVSLKNSDKADVVIEKVKEVHEVASEVVKTTNGLQEKLVASTAKASEAIGLAKGLKQGRDERG